MQATINMAANGRVVLPANMRAAFGVTGGAKMVARLENGAIILEPIEAAIRRAQAMVRAYVPEGAGIVDEFIAERRVAVARA